MFRATPREGWPPWPSLSSPPNADDYGEPTIRITNECHIFKYDSANNSWSPYDKVLRPSVSDQNGQILVNGYDSLQYCGYVPYQQITISLLPNLKDKVTKIYNVH